jgi:hypothetical protein
VKLTTTAPRAETIAKGQREALQSEVADLESRVALRESERRGLAAGRQRAVAIVSRKGGDESGNEQGVGARAGGDIVGATAGRDAAGVGGAVAGVRASDNNVGGRDEA